MEDLGCDVLYEVLAHLSPPDILVFARLSRTLRRIAADRVVWRNAYRASPLFLPAGPKPFHSAPDLQRLMMRAHKLERSWTADDVRPITTRTLPAKPNHPICSVRLVAGRYLLIGENNGLTCHDLDSKSWAVPFLRYKAVIRTGTSWMHYEVGDDTDSPVYVVFLQKRRQTFSAIILEMRFPPLEPSLELFAELPLEQTVFSGMRVMHGFLVVALQNNAVLYHIPTRQRLVFPPGFDASTILGRASFHRDYLIAAGYLLVLHLFSAMNEVVIEAFPLPTLPAASDAPPELVRSHIGVCPFGFTEATAVAATGTRITLLALTHTADAAHASRSGLRLFDIVLGADGTATVGAGHANVAPPQAISYGLATSVRAGTVRAVCLNAFGSASVLAVDAKTGPRGSADGGAVAVRALTVPGHLRVSSAVEFDGFRGRLCFNLDAGSVTVLDYA